MEWAERNGGRGELQEQMVLLRRIRFSGGISPPEEVAFWRRFPMLLPRESEISFFFFQSEMKLAGKQQPTLNSETKHNGFLWAQFPPFIGAPKAPISKYNIIIKTKITRNENHNLNIYYKKKLMNLVSF